jgi:ABC-type protease/lipase transport system fused ATPase/permease subunit
VAGDGQPARLELLGGRLLGVRQCIALAGALASHPKLIVLGASQAADLS